MPALLILTLSIRDTSDHRFCHGLTMESMLNQYAIHLRKFHYTMTHRISDQTLVESFIQWPMNVVFYENEYINWVHIFSLPWSWGREDKRQVPMLSSEHNTSITSDVKQAKYMNQLHITTQNGLCELNTRFSQICQLTTCQSIENRLPRRIYKLILTEQAPAPLINSISSQPFIRHLIIQRRLTDETEIPILAQQYPNVRYLQLLFPLEKSAFLHCFKTLFSYDDDTYEKFYFWPELVSFRTIGDYEQFSASWLNFNAKNWLIENTDLKFRSLSFRAEHSNPIFSIWL
ncbi:unnamed protein product [Rotaria sp. Silwood1]|nr:unnamed protein product [Rotaria sp. Silwood1]CAF1643043.1 unnamed protein product [Rotaria sp. Silwood1]CAF3954757.1 unnamed protein product [Rotaria sp. Silwood1]